MSVREVPKGFHSCLLGDVITLQRGFDLPSHERRSGDVPVVSSSGVTGWHNVAKVKAPGVVTGRYGTLGEVFYIEQDFWALNTTLFVSDFKGNQPKFVSYLLRTLSLKTQNAAGAVPGINRNVLHKIPIVVPEFKIRERITEILSNYDLLIDNNTSRIALLEESIHRLYKEWFVYLRFPGCDRVKVIDGVPEGWRRVTADQAVDFKPKTSVPKGVERPFVPMDSLSTNLMTIAQIDSRLIGGGAKFRNGDTLLARITPCLENGKTAFVQFMDDPAMVASGSTEFIVMRSKQVTPYWVYCLGRSYHFRQHAINSMAGSDGRQRVKPEALEQFELLLPPSPVLKKFDEIASPTFQQIQLLNSQAQKLREARDLLLPRLMNGSIAA